MTEVIASAVAPNRSGSPDPDNSLFWIATDKWLDPPLTASPNSSNDFVSTPRPFFLERYRSTATPFQWNRYIRLGFHTHLDGNEFDDEWTKDPISLIQRNKIVWYNFMYYVDRNIDIHPLLENWALHVAQPYLFKHDPSFLKINTIDVPWSSASQLPIEIDNDDEEWKTVGEANTSRPAKKQVTLHEPETRIRPPNDGGKEASVSKLAPLTSLRRAGILKKPTTPRTSTSLAQETSSEGDNRTSAGASPVPRPTLAPVPPFPMKATPASTVHASIENDTHASASIIDADVSMQSGTSTLYPDSQVTTTRVITNDGTQRITIRWTPSVGLSHDQKPEEWTSAALLMLVDLFGNDSGSFYPWGSKDLSSSTSPDKMNEAAVKEYLSPRIFYARTTKTFTFGVRYGFSTKTPVKWMSRDSTKAAMRKHKVWATVSNSSTTSGRLVRAGYILMKAPNLTHRIRFLQSLRAKMPDNTPFFDILHMKKSPAQQTIHHLVVQCGENHVEPPPFLSQALSAILKGDGSSLYLPRLALGNLTTEQIAKYFTTHNNYIKSLKMIRLAPAISHLDVEREELLDTGQVIIRSTRDWATTLTLSSNGICARCDVVNGGSDQATSTLLVPRHYEVPEYQLFSEYCFYRACTFERFPRSTGALKIMVS